MHGSCTLYLRPSSSLLSPLFPVLLLPPPPPSRLPARLRSPARLARHLARLETLLKRLQYGIPTIPVVPLHLFFSLIEREIFTKKIKQGKNYWDPILPVFSSSRRATATFYEITDRKRAISLNALGVLSSNGPLSLPDATTLDVDGRCAKLLPLRRFEKSRAIFRRVALDIFAPIFLVSRETALLFPRASRPDSHSNRVVCVFPAHDETSFSLPATVILFIFSST